MSAEEETIKKIIVARCKNILLMAARLSLTKPRAESGALFAVKDTSFTRPLSGFLRASGRPIPRLPRVLRRVRLASDGMSPLNGFGVP